MIRRQAGPVRFARVLACLFAVAASLPGAARAESSGGPFTLESHAVGPGGRSGAARLEALSSIQPLGAEEGLGPAGESLLGGFLRRYRTVEASSITAPGSALERDGQQFGVPTAASLEVGFSVPVSTESLIAATTVFLVYDRLGNRIEQPVPYELQFDPVSGQATFTSLGGWEQGGTYRIVIGTGTADAAGSMIDSTGTLTFQTVMDFSQTNVVRALGDEEARLEIPPGALPGSGFVIFHADPVNEPDQAVPSQILEANAKAAANQGSQATPILIREMNAYDSTGIRIQAAFDESLVTAILPYPDADGNGIVDGYGVRTRNLALWTLDERNSLWVRVPGSRVDLQNRVVRAPLKHFSVYSLISSLDTNVSLTYAYPIPWRPFSSDQARYGTPAGGITFVNLPQAGTIRIYTLTGQLVRSQALNGALSWVWDGRNGSGQSVTSGTYLWIAESGGNKKTGKLMVIK